MLFNSIEFAIFLPLVFAIYWFLLKEKLNGQNILIFCSSYIFYGWWDIRFLSLILISTLVDFLIGIRLEKEESEPRRKILLYFSLLVNLGMLGFFKYYNFFIESFSDAFTFLGYSINAQSLNIILPVGISFYTFQTLSYTIDVYKKEIKPTKNFIAFAAFVSFFPQLVAGPIERAKNLLPQFFIRREFSYNLAVDGLRQMLFGLFKKVVIADNCATIVNVVYNDIGSFSGSALLLASIFFAFQIYGDFSGYSDIAIGTSRLFGFNLKQNFAFPYFSRDIAEFWRRWHMSLTTWFRDYLYIPLGGSRGSKFNQVRNTFIIFLVSGFWHGASWNFVFWGLLNAIWFLPLLIFKLNRKNTNTVAENNLIPNLKDFCKIILTFFLTTITWIFFRADSLDTAFTFISGIFSYSLFSFPYAIGGEKSLRIIGLILIMILFEWVNRNGKHALDWQELNIPLLGRWSVYFFLLFLVVAFSGIQQDFIYFQF